MIFDLPSSKPPAFEAAFCSANSHAPCTSLPPTLTHPGIPLFPAGICWWPLQTPVWLHIFITRDSHVALKFHTHDQGLPSNLQRTGGPLLVSPQMSKLLIRNIVVPSGRVGESLLRAEHNGPWPERRTWVVSVRMVTPTLTVTEQKLCWGAAVRWVTANRRHLCSRV